MPPPDDWRELIDLATSPDSFASSALAGRVVFVIAADTSDADAVASALTGALGDRARVRQTCVLSQGIRRLFGNFGVTKYEDRVGGISALVTDEQFLQHTRALADDLLTAGDDPTVVVECCTEADDVLLMDLLYPDATVVQLSPGRRQRLRDAMRATRASGAARTFARVRPQIRNIRVHDVARNTVVESVTELVEELDLPRQPPVRATTAVPFDGYVFVLGSFRSGTTWLEHLLLSHPSACGLDGRESWVFEGSSDLWDNLTSGRLAREVDATIGVRALRRYVDALFDGMRQATNPTATYVVEKSPVHTDHLAQLATVYPDASYVNIVRDGRDVVRSMLEIEPDISVETAATMWRTAVGNVQRDSHHFERFVEVRYEDLVTDPVATSEKLLTWVGLEAGGNVLATLHERAGHHVSRRGTKGRPGPGKWRNDLSEAQLETLRRIADDELHAYGYE